jgi:hydrogenase maturation protein HypF
MAEKPVSPAVVRRRIRVRGIVQGVGFRPTVYRLATERGLTGWVRNDAQGVLIEVEGPAARLDDFLATLAADPPPLARVTAIETQAAAATGEAGFAILASAGGEKTALVSPDMAICPDCLREMRDPADRRFRYPFINCTNCGPRYSIILDIPYDRPKTTMRGFFMCPPCRAEYENPADRRFHAQPNACPVCGPRLALHDAQGWPVAADDPVRAVREALLVGRIVAIKGLTGFHLACDARNAAAVRELRRRKGRDQKPFAMMAASVAAAARRAVVGATEQALLESPERPIVLLRKRADHDLSALIAPQSPYFGFMLPYAPLHYLLFEDDFPPMVMTSGNLSEEPICREDGEALSRLAGIADLYLLHNRPIQTVCDDSVMMVQQECATAPTGRVPRQADGAWPGEPAVAHRRPLMLRRGRGFAPRPLALPVEAPEPILAVGPELKNAVCLVRGREAFVSQHIGDLKNALAAEYFEATIEKLQRLLEICPAVIAHDLHPAYLSTRFARRLAAEADAGDTPRPPLPGQACGSEDMPTQIAAWACHPARMGIRLVGVQHHHAHIVSVMAENGLGGEVLGLAMDGTGYGTDGAVWGGEVLRASPAAFQRLGHLAYVPLPGGDAAIEHPVRTAWAFLVQAYGPGEAERHAVGRLAGTRPQDRRLWAEMIAKHVNAPAACGLGRLFDAVSVLAGVCDAASYEGQAAVELEAAAEGGPDDMPPYDFAVSDLVAAARRAARPPAGGAASAGAPPWVLDTAPVIRGVVADIEAGRGPAEVAARFHATVAAMLLAAARRARDETRLERIALSGGCFANDRLVRTLVPALESEGLAVYLHHEVPPGDGGVALGQAYVAAAQLRKHPG